MQKAIRTIAISLAAIALCVALIVAGSYALFTDTVTVNNHLQAGTLDVTLKRTAWSSTTLNAQGYLQTESADESADPVDFSGQTERSVFEMTGGKLAPQCSFEATMQLTNGGSVAFSYWIELVVTEGKDTALVKQLTASIETQTGKTEQSLANGLLIGSETAPVGEVALDDEQSFTVTLTFEDLASTENNTAQNQTVKFDLIVHAVQLTAAN